MSVLPLSVYGRMDDGTIMIKLTASSQTVDLNPTRKNSLLILINSFPSTVLVYISLFGLCFFYCYLQITALLSTSVSFSLSSLSLSFSRIYSSTLSLFSHLSPPIFFLIPSLFSFLLFLTLTLHCCHFSHSPPPLFSSIFPSFPSSL